MPFWYGQVATKYVKVLNNPFAEEVRKQDIFEGERTGFTKLTVAEIV